MLKVTYTIKPKKKKNEIKTDEELKLSLFLNDKIVDKEYSMRTTKKN